jgi:hypothetical protein
MEIALLEDSIDLVHQSAIEIVNEIPIPLLDEKCCVCRESRF